MLREHELAIAPATYYAAKCRAPSARAVRDAELKPILARVHAANYGVYGVRKLHAALRRDGIELGRDHTVRLMLELGLAGARRGKSKRTTIRDDAAARPAGLVERDFSADRPDRLWVADLTYLRTSAGFAYLALVIDLFSRRIVGWALAGNRSPPTRRSLCSSTNLTSAAVAGRARPRRKPRRLSRSHSPGAARPPPGAAA